MKIKLNWSRVSGFSYRITCIEGTETATPASTDRDTGASHSFSPAENTISVTVPSGTVFRHTSETVPAARTESSERRALILVLRM